MRAFKVFLNGKKLCVAGIGDDGVLTACVGLATGKGPMELHLHVGGLISPSRESVIWVGQQPLHLGNKVQVQLVEVPSVNEPQKRERPDPARDLEVQKNLIRAMAERLGWKIQETPRKKSAEPKPRRKK
jgi:hypothetical protein